MKQNRRSQPAADPLQVFNHACRFLGTDQALRKVFGGSDWGIIIGPPTMVLSAFASELFLKCLLILETGEAPENIHPLHVLYRRVSHKRRRRIEELWDNDARPKLAGLAQALNLPTDLPNALFQCSKAFEQLRYAYENNFNNVRYYIGDFPWIVMRAIVEVKPEWTPSEPPPIPMPRP
jgi:hypothetical protein